MNLKSSSQFTSIDYTQNKKLGIPLVANHSKMNSKVHEKSSSGNFIDPINEMNNALTIPKLGGRSISDVRLIKRVSSAKKFEIIMKNLSIESLKERTLDYIPPVNAKNVSKIKFRKV